MPGLRPAEGHADHVDLLPTLHRQEAAAMPNWLMKTGDDEYVEWSTIVDAPVTDLMTRDEALSYSADLFGSDEAAVERLRHTDAHLCSCTARLGERVEVRNGQAIMVAGGDLAYHFDTYRDVRDFMGWDG